MVSKNGSASQGDRTSQQYFQKKAISTVISLNDIFEAKR